MPIREIFVEQLFLIFLGFLKQAVVTGVDGFGLVTSTSQFGEFISNFFVFVTLFLHVNEELILFVEIHSDGLEGRGTTTMHRSVHFQLLLILGVKDLIGSWAFVASIADEGVRLHNLGLVELDAEDTCQIECQFLT